jgi:hypothetical protein
MKYTQDLKSIWQSLVRREKISDVYKDGTIEIGIIMGDLGPEYYAGTKEGQNKGEYLSDKIEERFIAGTDFVIQYNPFRGQRPASKVHANYEGRINAPTRGIENCRFGCSNPQRNLSLLVREPSGQILPGYLRYNRYYNTLPIEEEGHFMYVPVEKNGIEETIPHIEQKMTQEMFKDTLEIAKSSEDAITFFNSIHAGAIVDHFHIQQIFYRRHLRNGTPLRGGKLAIENAMTEDYNGRKITSRYPAYGFVDTINSKIWQDIKKLQEKDIPFNWILIEDKSYLFPRNVEKEKVCEFPDIIASFECVGKIITTDKEIYDNMNRDKLYSAFEKTTRRDSEILNLLAPTPLPSPQAPLYSSNEHDPCSQCAERLTGVGGEPCIDCIYRFYERD